MVVVWSVFVFIGSVCVGWKVSERHFTLPWGAGAERFVKFSRAEGPGGTHDPRQSWEEW